MSQFGRVLHADLVAHMTYIYILFLFLYIYCLFCTDKYDIMFGDGAPRMRKSTHRFCPVPARLPVPDVPPILSGSCKCRMVSIVMTYYVRHVALYFYHAPNRCIVGQVLYHTRDIRQ